MSAYLIGDCANFCPPKSFYDILRLFEEKKIADSVCEPISIILVAKSIFEKKDCIKNDRLIQEVKRN